MITVDKDTFIIDIPDPGVTIRTLLAVAAEAGKEVQKRTWRIRLNKAIVGSVRVKLTK